MPPFQNLVNTFTGVQRALELRRQFDEKLRLREAQEFLEYATLAQEIPDGADRAAIVNLAEDLGLTDSPAAQAAVAALAPARGVTRRATIQTGAEDLAGTPQGREVAQEGFTREVTGGSEFQLQSGNFLENVLPTEEELDASFNQALARGLASRLAVGTDQGTLRINEAVSQLPAPEIDRSIAIDQGRRMDAGELGRLSLDFAAHRQDERRIEQRGSLAEARLQIQRDGLVDRTQALEAGEPINVSNALSEFSTIMRALQEQKGAMSEAELQMFANALNAYNRRLAQEGIVIFENPLTVEDIEQGVINVNF